LDEIVADLRGPKKLMKADCWPSGQYDGSQADGTLRRGHMKGAVNTPIVQLRDSTGKFLSSEKLKLIFEGLGATNEKTIITYCTSGI